jgi:hypothetical protein
MDDNFRIKHFGLVPRAINYLFQRLREKAQETNGPYYIRVSYCEIYNEQVEHMLLSVVMLICNMHLFEDT